MTSFRDTVGLGFLQMVSSTWAPFRGSVGFDFCRI